MGDTWDDCALMWDDDVSVREYADKAFSSLTSHLQQHLLNSRRILDFGCGTGLLTELIMKSFPSAQIVALDTSSKMIEVLAGKNIKGVTPVCLELTPEAAAANPELQEKFDIIVASSVCAFIPNYESIASLLHNLLASGGVFVQWDWELTEKNPEFGLAEERMSTVLDAAGFKNITILRPFTMTSEDLGVAQVLMGIGNA